MDDFDFRFQTFDDPSLVEMLDKARSFCADMLRNENPRWLAFLGKTGTGKTHLAKAINRFFRENMDGQLVPGQDLDKTRWRMKGGFKSWRTVARYLRDGDFSILRDIQEDNFAVIDDIGAEYKAKSDFLLAKLDELIDGRLGKWTVITANLTLDQIAESMDVRIASRLMRGGSNVLVVDTLDYNLR